MKNKEEFVFLGRHNSVFQTARKALDYWPRSMLFGPKMNFISKSFHYHRKRCVLLSLIISLMGLVELTFGSVHTDEASVSCFEGCDVTKNVCKEC